MEDLQLGIYQHFKGNLYEVITVGKDSDTLEDLVVYKALYDSAEFGKNAIWIRPKEKFCEEIIVDGKKIPRFKFVE
ncbi:MAG TPA: DUF1653 domain-containing protein [Candidatus Magasanikbacteria bacterium]|jgi:hypothetical protein|nr:DUF1653 domain-containing protein [Candidatus Magasanikbacteria bacterium]